MFYLPQQCALVPPLQRSQNSQLKAIEGKFKWSLCLPLPSCLRFALPHAPCHLPPFPSPSPSLSHNLWHIASSTPAPVPAPRLIQINTQRSHNHRGLCPCAPAPCTHALSPFLTLPTPSPHYHCVNA